MTWLVIAGYMGAGKTTVGRRLAERIGVPFVDADREIVAQVGMDIPEIFAKRGELWFRRTEEDVVREILERRPAGVLALGGGALVSRRTRALVRRVARGVWLRVHPDVAWERVSGSDRPLVNDRDRFVRRAVEREPGYREACVLALDAELPVMSLVERIAEWAASAPRDPDPVARS